MTGAHADGLVKENSRGALSRQAYLVSGDQSDVNRMVQERTAIKPGQAFQRIGSHTVCPFDKSQPGLVELREQSDHYFSRVGHQQALLT
jgi:hypothetical protein